MIIIMIIELTFQRFVDFFQSSRIIEKETLIGKNSPNHSVGSIENCWV